ncbi:uncharacterized protein [Diadema setosum]|uniref:uncharacterized protein n=1 Tax=Diadema setosum TaxID=31175 RepID=UPI003B3ADD93
MMFLLASVLLLSCGLSNVGAITCNECMEMSSTLSDLQAEINETLAEGYNCQTPIRTICPDRCIAQQFIFTFTSDTSGDDSVTLTQLGCSYQNTTEVPLRDDNCFSTENSAGFEDVLTQYTQYIYKHLSHSGILPSGMTLTDTAVSLCLCDTDNCNVVPETTTAGAVHILGSAIVLIGSLLSAIVFQAV